MKFPRCPIRTKCLTQARKEAKVMYPKCTGEDIYRYVQDVSRRVIQARLGVQLQRGAKWRLLPEDQCETNRVVSKNNKLQMNKKAKFMTLTGLKIFPSVGEQSGETTIGTLEGHLNGFSYSTSSPNFHFHFLYRNVKNAFFRYEDEKMLPLLHFHLHHPIKVGAEKRQNVHFHLVQIPVGQKRYYNDSDKIVGPNGPNKDLKNFVHKVQAKWSHLPVVHYRYPFAGVELHKKDEFQGNLPSK
ncbi:FACT complex subunit SPT16-like [Papaver somniferum]|uniref:FACT complex subunit SPT16-like n=1 Tax=Papaver somniferum TaxID=3469 RepID=UPI000E6FEEF3|nr:FACT complex subunit SPT16-like [Papaver somniferum]